ncbi:deoxyribose-phosphate aldolase [Kurthia sp. Dielmo]|uniref:deoxyribose-phosphate aldolase n=1 Tax=Kurthia sp. Dielmo TaxID=1033738 RepID=UPI001121690F|nr:deoxyribose-phosphate aldolase [Kurthia sp. Dielmo]
MNKSKYIDHTLLKADATQSMIEKLAQEAKKHDFASVCVNPYWVPLCAKLLAGTDVKVCTVIGFPLGANTTATKVFETQNAIENGATEVDMVINIGELKNNNLDVVQQDIEAVVNAAKGKALTKVIIETALLTKEEIIAVSKLVTNAKAEFIKTSTGFSTAGATAENVKLMADSTGTEVAVKASGGVRTQEDFEVMVSAGATRVGASNGVALM